MINNDWLTDYRSVLVDFMSSGRALRSVGRVQHDLSIRLSTDELQRHWHWPHGRAAGSQPVQRVRSVSERSDLLQGAWRPSRVQMPLQLPRSILRVLHRHVCPIQVQSNSVAWRGRGTWAR